MIVKIENYYQPFVASDYAMSQQSLVVYPGKYEDTLSISILPDSVVLEGVQTLTLEIERVGGQVVAIFMPTTISIVDTDGKTLLLIHRNYRNILSF